MGEWKLTELGLTLPDASIGLRIEVYNEIKINNHQKHHRYKETLNFLRNAFDAYVFYTNVLSLFLLLLVVLIVFCQKWEILLIWQVL